MSNLSNTIHNTETNEIISQPLTAEELEVHKIGGKIAQDILENGLNKESSKTALLAKLGLNAEDLKTLLS